jgi:S1-C subfamily serine protease
MSTYLFILLSLFQTQTKTFPNLKIKPQRTLSKLRLNPTVKAVKKASPAVIHILATRKVKNSPFSFGKFKNSRTGTQVKKVLGSGVIFDSRGYAITNEHVVSSADIIKVTLSNKKSYFAKVIGADRKLDIAVIKIQSKTPLPIAILGSSKSLMPGETVIAIGSPHGFSFTISKGVISAVHRNVLIKSRVYGNAIQTDAAINPGNSGGPLINILGEVIAINTFKKMNASNMGFAIPIDKVKTVARELLIHKKVRAIYLGMTIKESKNSIYITKINPNSPIAKSGLKVGDKIIKIKSYNINGIDDFSIIISTLIVGEKVKFITSKGTKIVLVGKLSSSVAYIRFVKTMGIRLTKASKGLSISWINKYGSAYKLGLRINDIFTSINRKPIITKMDLSKILLSLRKTRSLYTIINRKGYNYPLTINY